MRCDDGRAPQRARPGAKGGGPAAGTRLVLAPDTRRLGPGLVCGGSPLHVLRLTAAGDRWLDRWSAGQAVSEGVAARNLAARLVDAGLAWSRPAPDPYRSVSVVVPCRDQPEGLAATLAALDAGVDAIVVDDASRDPARIARVVAGRPGTRLIRRVCNGGPAAARNDGWRAVSRDLVAFVDTGCLPPPGWLAQLAGHFPEEPVGAVAARIRPVPTPGGAAWVDAYEQVRSPLDLGPRAGPVRPRALVPYVPTAALVVRRAALVDLDGFDEDLRTGEDVDLVWRLDAAGWRVRYDPSVVVGHPVRPGLGAWVAQRAGYGRSAAPLASRHGRDVAPLTVPRGAAAAWVLAGLGHPVAAAVVAAASTAHLAARAGTLLPGPAPPVRLDGVPPGPSPRAAINRAVWRGHLLAGRGLADAIRRAWWPVAAVTAAICPRTRPALAAVVIAPPLLEWHRRRPALGPLRWVGLRLVDDVAYGAGVWSGVIRARRGDCLRPDLAR